MNIYRKFFLMQAFLMEKKGEGEGGGGGGGAPDLAKELATEREARAALEARLAKLEAGGKKSKERDESDDDDDDESDEDDEDLSSKAKKLRADREKNSSDAKALEAALRFNLGAESWLKQNQTLLPKDISDIFKAAEKENYGSAIEKDAAIKAGIIQSFFAVQSNLDLLTPAIKGQLEDYLKLTKTGKQEKAQQMYDSIFEPAFEMLRRVKKAEALNKGFGGGGSASEDAYKTKMMNLSKKHYLGEKQ